MRAEHLLRDLFQMPAHGAAGLLLAPLDDVVDQLGLMLDGRFAQRLVFVDLMAGPVDVPHDGLVYRR